MFCLCVPSDLIVSGLLKGCVWSFFFSVYHRTRFSLDSKKGADDHVLSPHAIGLDCICITKRVWMTMFCLRVPSDLIVFGEQRRYGWPCFVSTCHRTWLSLDSKKGCGWPCFVSAGHRPWLSLDSKNGADDQVLSLRAIGLDCLWIAKGVWMTMLCLCVSSDLIVSV